MRLWSVYCLIVFAVSVCARRITFDDPNMPIRVVETSFGVNNHERVTYLRAEIYPSHVTNNSKINFPTYGHLNDYYMQARAQGDVRGHHVAAQFSGPAEWYNLTPQNARVNRDTDFQSVTTDWYETECEVRRFLERDGKRSVIWLLRMSYPGDSNRPNQYHLQVLFLRNCRVVDSIDSNNNNPFQWEDSNFWFCRQCRDYGHEDDELDSHQRIAQDCYRNSISTA